MAKKKVVATPTVEVHLYPVAGTTAATPPIILSGPDLFVTENGELLVDLLRTEDDGIPTMVGGKAIFAPGAWRYACVIPAESALATLEAS